MADEYPDLADQPGRINQRGIYSNGIRGYNVENFTFDKGKGGTLTLGGSSNVNGLLSVLDSSAVEKVRIDNTGITVTDGKISVQNASGSASLDSLGVTSSANFANGAASSAISLNQLITSSTAADVTGATFTFTPPRTVYAYMHADINVYMVQGGAGDYRGNGIIYLKVDGLEKSRAVECGGLIGTDHIGCGNSSICSTSVHYLGSLDNTSHTIKLMASRDVTTGTPTFVIYSFRFSYFILGT